MHVVVGDPPKLISGVTDVTVISPEVVTLECCVRPGTKDPQITWYVIQLQVTENLNSNSIAQ